MVCDLQYGHGVETLCCNISAVPEPLKQLTTLTISMNSWCEHHLMSPSIQFWLQGPSTRSQVTSPAVVAGTGAKPGDARKTIKSMAASLFKAFDEGKLREQGPALGRPPPDLPCHNPLPPAPPPLLLPYMYLLMLMTVYQGVWITNQVLM